MYPLLQSVVCHSHEIVGNIGLKCQRLPEKTIQASKTSIPLKFYFFCYECCLLDLVSLPSPPLIFSQRPPKSIVQLVVGLQRAWIHFLTTKVRVQTVQTLKWRVWSVWFKSFHSRMPDGFENECVLKLSQYFWKIAFREAQPRLKEDGESNDNGRDLLASREYRRVQSPPLQQTFSACFTLCFRRSRKRDQYWLRAFVFFGLAREGGTASPELTSLEASLLLSFHSFKAPCVPESY